MLKLAIAIATGGIAALQLIGVVFGKTPSGRFVNFLAAAVLGGAVYYMYN